MSNRRRILSVTAHDKTVEMQTFRSGGSGGQNQNKRDTGVRFIHRPSGAVGEARDERSQHANKKLAWRRMFEHPKFQLWLKKELGQIAVDEDTPIPSEELLVEVKVNGKWVKE